MVVCCKSHVMVLIFLYRDLVDRTLVIPMQERSSEYPEQRKNIIIGYYWGEDGEAWRVASVGMKG